MFSTGDTFYWQARDRKWNLAAVPLALLTGSQPQGKSPGSHSTRTQFKTNTKKAFPPCPRAAHCTADGSFRQRWYSSLAQRSHQESSIVGTGSVFLSAPSKACFGEQQQLQLTGTYSSSRQTAPAIPDGESLSSPASLEIPRGGLGKYLTCSSSHQKSVTGFQPNLQASSMDALCAAMRASAGTGRKTEEACCWGGQHHRSLGQLKLSQAHTRVVDPWE